MNQTISISKILGDGAWEGPMRALYSLARALKGPGSFDPKEFLWFLLSDLLNEKPIKASEAWLFYIK